MAIRNAGESTDMKAITLNEQSAKLKGKYLGNPHYAKPRNVRHKHKKESICQQK